VRRACSLLLAVPALLSSGCASGLAAERQPGVVTVVSTISAWGSILGQLGGSHVHAISIIKSPATDPHDYEPTPADARALASAQLLVENGVGYDAWASKAVAANPVAGRAVIDVGKLVGIRSDGNPHRWYSPSDVDAVAAAITARLVAIDPVGASESIVAPLATALGLKLVTPPDFLRAISEGIDPSAADKATIDRQIAEREIKVYLYNRQNGTPDVAAQVKAARAAGIPVVAFTETLTPTGASFQQWQVAQLQSLQAALATGTGA
jgi:zinc/manganese transport system substrate-binding protein